MFPISPEWLLTVLTVVPVAVAAFWLVYGPCLLWRRWIWDERAAELVALGRVRAVFNGWRVDAPGGRVRVVGGITGVVTVVRVGKRKTRIPGLATEEEIRRALAAN